MGTLADSSQSLAVPSGGDGPQLRTVQRQVPVVQKVQKTVEVPQIEFVDTQVHIPVQRHRHIPMVTTVQKIVEVPQIETVELTIPGAERLVGATAAKDDGPRSVDRLGHGDYAKALAKVVAGPVSCTPVTVGLYADWGSGKSHMMNQLMAEFHAINAANKLIDRLDDNLLGNVDPYELQRPNYVSVWFNTWLYAGSQNLWAGLIAALYDATEGHFGTKYCAVLRLSNSSYYKYLVWPIALILIALLILIAFGAFVRSLWFLHESPVGMVMEYLLEHGILKEEDKKVIIATSVVSVLTTALGALQFFQTQADNLRKAASSPSWKEKIGHMADVKDELEYIGGLLREGPRWDLVIKRLLYPFAKLHEEIDSAISVDGLSSVVDRFQELQKTLLQDHAQAEQDGKAQKGFESSLRAEWEGLRRRGKQLDASSVDQKFASVFPEPSAKQGASVVATSTAPAGAAPPDDSASAPAATVTGGRAGYTQVPVSSEETTTPLLGVPSRGDQKAATVERPWWEGFYADSAGNLMSLSKLHMMDPTSGMPDPATIESQRQAYERSLAEQLAAGLKSLDEQGGASIKLMKEAAKEQRRSRAERDSQETQLREELDTQKRALNEARDSQLQQLKEQAEQLTSSYYAALKRKRELNSGNIISAMVKCSTRPWMSGVREVTTTPEKYLAGRLIRKHTVIRQANSSEGTYHAKLSRGWHGLGRPRITWMAGPNAGETWYRQRNKARGARFVVFVDDLDRCPPAKVAEVLQCIVLLTENTPFVIVLAIDPRLVVKAIEAAYDKSIIAAGMNGYAFLDKVVQLPFAIPHMTVDESQQFVDSFADEEVLIKEREQRGLTGGYDPYGGIGMVTYERLQQQRLELKVQRDEWLKKLANEKDLAVTKLTARKAEELAVLDRLKSEARSKVSRSGSQSFGLVAPQLVTPTIGSVASRDRGAAQQPARSDSAPVEEIVEVPMIQEEIVHVPVVVQQQRTHHVEVEQIVDVHVPHEREEIIHVPVVQRQSVERLVDFDKASAGLLGPDEVGMFRYLTNFLDRNPRRIKRIMNIYAISRELMATRSSTSLSQGVDKAMLIKFIILCEQWPYRMSWIVHLLEDCQQMIVGTSQDKLDEAQYNVYCRNVGAFASDGRELGAFPPMLPALSYPIDAAPPFQPPYTADTIARQCSREEDLDRHMADAVAAVEKRNSEQMLQVETAARLASWQLDASYNKRLVAIEKMLTVEDHMEPVDIHEIYRFVQYFVYDSSTWQATLEEDASYERRSILSMDSDPELFEALLRTPPAITVDRIGSYRRRDPGKLASYLMNLNPALRALVAWQAGHRESTEGGQYISKFQAHIQREVEENHQARRLIQRVQAQMGTTQMPSPTYGAPTVYAGPTDSVPGAGYAGPANPWPAAAQTAPYIAQPVAAPIA